MALKSYDPRRVQVIVGVKKISGFMPGDSISDEPMSDGSSSVAGMDGEVGRALGTDPRRTLTLNLMQTSDDNTYLNGLYELDRATNGDGAFPVLIQDNNGITTIAGAQAWIRRKPAIVFSGEISGRSWAIEYVADTDIIGASGV